MSRVLIATKQPPGGAVAALDVGETASCKCLVAGMKTAQYGECKDFVRVRDRVAQLQVLHGQGGPTPGPLPSLCCARVEHLHGTMQTD